MVGIYIYGGTETARVGEPVASANAGSPSCGVSDITGPAWLRWSLGHYTRMELAIFILLTGASGAYFTSVGCRRALARHRRVGWHLILPGTFITALLTALLIGQGDLFHPSRWDSCKVSIWLPVTVVSLAAAVVAFVASAIVALAFRASIRDDDTVA